jgi:pimeloyl-ACP methyl ester carboxylesterase
LEAKLKDVLKHIWVHDSAPSGVDKITYRSILDGVQDWALIWRSFCINNSWIVFLHGHGSSGNQIFTRADIRDEWLTHFRKNGFGVLSPNLRGNAWMCPEAATDLHLLLEWVRSEYRAKNFYFVSGSMGGTGNLIYSTLYPKDVTCVVALCAVTDIRLYHEWCCFHPGKVIDEIRLAIESAYGGSPDQVPGRYAKHVVTQHLNHLSMPLFLSHATGDDVIPVEQSRNLHKLLSRSEKLTYTEIAEGNHDSPLQGRVMLEWLDNQIKNSN